METLADRLAAASQMFAVRKQQRQQQPNTFFERLTSLYQPLVSKSSPVRAVPCRTVRVSEYGSTFEQLPLTLVASAPVKNEASR